MVGCASASKSTGGMSLRQNVVIPCVQCRGDDTMDQDFRHTNGKTQFKHMHRDAFSMFSSLSWHNQSMHWVVLGSLQQIIKVSC